MRTTFDLHQQITDKIIQSIENNPGRFVMPWHQGATSGSPLNAISRRKYNGINQISLWIEALDRGYATSEWATFKQWTEKQAKVRKGEKAALVVFYKTVHAATENGEELEAQAKYFIAKPSWVFNAAQVDGYTPTQIVEPPKNMFERISLAENAIRTTLADIRFGGSRACYFRDHDFIQMPRPEDFTGSPTSTAQESFYATLFHELAHWTGAPKRLDREKGKRFGDRPYAFEELIADLSAAMSCAEFGVACEPRADHAQYIAGWLKVLKDDKKAIFQAAAAASAATSFIKGFSESTKPA